MFKEFLPLLATRSLILTVGSVKDERIRVTVTPRPTNKDEPREVLQPFIVEGTAEELDNELPKAIETYTGEILTLTQTVERLKASTAEALAAIKAENDKKIADAKKKPGVGSPKRAAKTEPKPEPVKPPAPPSLFDVPADEAAPVAATAPAQAKAGTTSDDDPEDTPEDPGDDDDVEDEAEDEEDTASGSSNVSTFPTPTVATAQSSMFDEEEEILREAFHGA